jgi:hypothetical protein
MRILALITLILGLAALVFGVVFIFMAGSGQQEIADSIAPLTLGEVNAKYEAVSAKYDGIKMAEEPNIQAGQALPSPMYNYLSSQRALLGLAKANIGNVKAVRINGIVDIMVGASLILTGIVLYRKNG